MKYVVLGLKGIAYGITHIVPGLGGGLILILLGVYEQFVDALGNFFVNPKRWKEYLAFLVPLGIGMVVGMLVLAKLIDAMLQHYPAATMFFFMGLLVGTIPSVLRMHGDMRLTIGRAAALFGGLLVVVGLGMLEPQTGQANWARAITSAGGVAYNLFISFLAGGASVTPGLDGSYVLLLGGTYGAVIEAVAALSELIIRWGTLLSTGIGAVLGIISFSKLIDAVLKRAPAVSYYAVLGLVVGSVYGLWPHEARAVSVPVLAIAFLLGVVLALLFGRRSARNGDSRGRGATDAPPAAR